MEKPVIIADPNPEKSAKAKLPYKCPSIVELDLTSTNNGTSRAADGLQSGSVTG